MSITRSSGTRRPVHVGPGLLAEVGAPRHVVTQQVAGGQVGDAVPLGEALTLGALASAGGREQQGSEHAFSLWVGGRVGRRWRLGPGPDGGGGGSAEIGGVPC